VRLKDIIAFLALQVPTTDLEVTLRAGVDMQDFLEKCRIGIPILHFSSLKIYCLLDDTFT